MREPKIDEYIRRIWDEKAALIQTHPIQLKSSRFSHVYVNNRNFVCLPENMEIVLSLFEDHLKSLEVQEFALCNVDSSVSPLLVSALSQRLRVPMYLYRPLNNEKGIKADVFSYDYNTSSRFKTDLPAVLIDDVVTTADTIAGTALSLQETKPARAISCAVVLVDRRVESEKRNSPVKIIGIVSLSEILEYAIRHVKMTDDSLTLAKQELSQLRT